MDQVTDGFWNKMVGCCPLVSQALTTNQQNQDCLKRFSVTCSLSLRKSGRFLVPDSNLATYHIRVYIQQQAGSLLHFSKGQQPVNLNEKDLDPCGIVLTNAYFEAFHLRLPQYIQALITQHCPCLINISHVHKERRRCWRLWSIRSALTGHALQIPVPLHLNPMIELVVLVWFTDLGNTACSAILLEQVPSDPSPCGLLLTLNRS